VDPHLIVRERPMPKCIWQLIEARAADRSDADFLRFQGETISYAMLRSRVMETAAVLSTRGIAAGDRVALMMHSHPDHIVIYLALGWIGAIVVEISVHLKRSGIALQLEDCAPKAAIVDHAFAGEVSDAVAGLSPIRILVRQSGDKAQGSFAPLPMRDAALAPRAPLRATLERVQTISYTSGTTGRPKGVVMTDRYFQLGAASAARLADVRDGDVMFLWEPFYHFAAWMTVLISLQRGVTIALVERFSASQCWEQMRAGKATLLHHLGGVINILLKQPPQANDADNPVRIAWGAAAPAHSWREFETRFGVTLREGYGISEAQNFTHLNLEGRVGSIGKPIPELESWIEGDDGRRLPPRDIGEIVVRPKLPGIIMQGYFGDPVRTAETIRNGCVYTGDLGYQDEDGFYYYAGRKKDSLRRRGENVSAWEVERVINAHPAVEEAAVVGVNSGMGEQDIRVFVKLAPGETLEPIELIRWCERDLAYYQIPRFVDFVDEFPRGPTQRIRKGDLPVDTAAGFDLERTGYTINRQVGQR
jgi:crotonobetaine/carnitine-CoA ligase